MIERFYDPKKGEILLDGKGLKGFSLAQLRNSIGYVSQEPVLILGTIRENLLNANCNASQEDIEEALRKANADFVKNLEDGLDTYIGSASVANLSGGQKQRLAIARALIKKPKILILDEATSALDPKSEGEVQEAIDKIAKEEAQTGGNLTIIMIAHRLQTIATAQNLLFIESPKKILEAEKGTAEYDKIMEKLQVDTYAHQQEDLGIGYTTAKKILDQENSQYSPSPTKTEEPKGSAELEDIAEGKIANTAMESSLSHSKNQSKPGIDEGDIVLDNPV